MLPRAIVLFACLLAASAAFAQTIYKYRHADGRITYSSRLIPGAELVETLNYRYVAPAAPAAADPKAAKSAAAVDDRISRQLAALDAAWNELQNATAALAVAEARLAAGVAPREGEGVALGGPEIATSPSEGGPQAPSLPAVGGPQPPAAPAKGQTIAQAAADARAVGGPMGTRRGGGRNAEYGNRMAALESDVSNARTRVDAAQFSYNQLR